MGTLLQDLRYGLRMLLRDPGLTLIAIVTLALGIGANTAIFSVVNAVLLRPLPYQQPESLALIRQNLPRLNQFLLPVSYPEFADYREGNEVFSEVAGFENLNLNLTGQGEPQRIQAARISASLFPLLGVQPLLGRPFSNEEDRVGGNSNVVILSHGLWQRSFGADPSVTDKVLKLDDRPYTVIGVMPQSFQFPQAGAAFGEPAELWIPLALTSEEMKARASSFDLNVIGRLKPGVSLGQAQANVETVAARFQQQYPEIYKGDVEVTPTVLSFEQQVVRKVRPLLLILLAAVCMVLLIACANVANLLLARAVIRRKEIAIRCTMGATTQRLVRQLLTESILLALLGGGAGLLLAVWAIDLIVKFGPEEVPRLQEARLDPQVLGFTLLVSLLTGLLFGLAPALESSRLNLNEALKETGGRASQGREGKRLRSLLVIFETASALVLLVGAGLLINSFVRLTRVPPGFDPQGVAIAHTALPSARYPKPEERKAVHKQVLERLAALPGVEAVAATTSVPLTGEWTIGLRMEEGDREAIHLANNAWVSDGYFKAMGIALINGRTFTEQDRPNAPPAIVINETMARRFWPTGDALGKRIRWGGWGEEWLTIVGVVADVKVSSLSAETKPTVYMPMFQVPGTRYGVAYIARATAGADSPASALRGEIAGVDEELPVYSIRTMDQVMAESIAQQRFSMLLLAVFAATALLLAAIGLYGVISYSVTQRTREIGIRMALGAKPGDVMKLIVRHGVTLTLAGIALGLIAAFALTRLMSSLLFGVGATDPLTFIIISLILTVVALVACFVPARRATKVDPMVALRYE